MAHLKSKGAVRTSAFLHILGCCFLHTPPFSWTFSLIFDLLHRSKLWIPPRFYLITSKPQLPGCQVWVCGKNAGAFPFSLEYKPTSWLVDLHSPCGSGSHCFLFSSSIIPSMTHLWVMHSLSLLPGTLSSDSCLPCEPPPILPHPICLILFYCSIDIFIVTVCQFKYLYLSQIHVESESPFW